MQGGRKLTAAFQGGFVYVVAKLIASNDRRIPKWLSTVGLPAWRQMLFTMYRSQFALLRIIASMWTNLNRGRNLWMWSEFLVPNRSLHRDELEAGQFKQRLVDR